MDAYTMIDLHTMFLFISASALLGFAPGPDNLFVLAQSIVNGRSAGFIITLGLCTGLLVHTTIVALGVSAIFRTSIIAFNTLKYCGVAYLLYLSWKSLRASSEELHAADSAPMNRPQLYRRGIIMNVTNPKVSIFFMAFLPQFASPSRGSITLQLIELGILFIATTIVVFGVISQLAGLIGGWISRSARGRLFLNRIAGVVFLSLAVKLIFTDRG